MDERGHGGDLGSAKSPGPGGLMQLVRLMTGEQARYRITPLKGGRP